MAKRKGLSLEEISSQMEQSDDNSESDEELNSLPDEDELQDAEESEIELLLEDLEIEEENDEARATPLNQPVWGEFAGRQKRFRYTGRGGINIRFSTNVTPKDIYSKLLNTAVLDLIVQETNRYARQGTQDWTDTNKKEILKFLGLTIWMGLDRRGRIRNYWSRKTIYKNDVAPRTMSRNRYQALLRNIHFANNAAIQEGDRLGKIRPLLSLMTENFKALYTPEEKIVVDESLVPWRGRLIFRQYIPNKAHKYGIKLFKLCSSDGYVWSLQVYGGKNAATGREIGQAERVCRELTAGLRMEGRTLYVDNFYTSYSLAKFFLEENTHVVGTLRANKANIPKDVLQKQLTRGEVICREDINGIVVLKWRDVRDVRLLTTKHGPELADFPARTRSMANQRVKRKPVAIQDYNKGKAGIDLSDQHASLATSLRKGIKWYRKLAIEIILGMAVVNSYIIFKKLSPKQVGLREFKEELVEVMLELPQFTQHPKPVEVAQKHILKETLPKIPNKRKQCVICYEKISKEENREAARRSARKVYSFCQDCPNKPYMCIHCFEKHHSK